VQPGDDPEAARPGHLISGISAALQARGNQPPREELVFIPEDRTAHER